MRGAWKGLIVGLLLTAGAVGAFIGLAKSDSTDCFAGFATKPQAEGVLDRAHAIGLDDTDLIEHRRSAAIRISSGETGDDAAAFRQTVRRLVGEGGRRPYCMERPYFR